MTALTQSHGVLTQAGTEALAKGLAGCARAGDTFLLEGPIGAGKSTFARAFIRARLGAPGEDVPSPTFTIVQTYEDEAGDIWHCDLYRMIEGSDLSELGLDEAFETAICLIEWPDRLGTMAPKTAIHVAFEAGHGGHRVEVTGDAETISRLMGGHD